MAQHENDPLFQPPLTGITHDDDASAPAGDAAPAAPTAAASEEPARSAPRGLLRKVGIPVALAAAGLLTGATLTGVAMAAGSTGSDGSDGHDGGRSGVSQDGGPALTIPDEDDIASGDAGTSFTLPDQPSLPDQDHQGGRGGHGAPDGEQASALGGSAPSGHTSTGASA